MDWRAYLIVLVTMTSNFIYLEINTTPFGEILNCDENGRSPFDPEGLEEGMSPLDPDVLEEEEPWMDLLNHLDRKGQDLEDGMSPLTSFSMVPFNYYQEDKPYKVEVSDGHQIEEATSLSEVLVNGADTGLEKENLDTVLSSTFHTNVHSQKEVADIELVQTDIGLDRYAESGEIEATFENENSCNDDFPQIYTNATSSTILLDDLIDAKQDSMKGSPDVDHDGLEERKPEEVTFMTDNPWNISLEIENSMCAVDEFKATIDKIDSESILEETETTEIEPRQLSSEDTSTEQSEVIRELNILQNTHLKEIESVDNTSSSLIGCILYEHVLEPIQAWWVDGWLKYLRQYLRDVRYLIKSISSILTDALKKITIKSHRIYFLMLDTIVELNEVSFDMILTGFGDYLKWAKSNFNILWDDAVMTFAEVCDPYGKVRLSIRHFMHDKDFRFNYFWYWFYTILIGLNIFLALCMMRKVLYFLRALFGLICRWLRFVFHRKKMVDMEVGTEPYDYSVITVDLDVLRRLEQNQETEEDRRAHIRDLMDRIEYARRIEDWSVGKREELGGMIDRCTEERRESSAQPAQGMTVNPENMVSQNRDAESGNWEV